MKYYSTRNEALRFSASQAIAKGLADDGGLFVPEYMPEIGREDLEAMLDMDYRQRAFRIMSEFLDDFSACELESYINAAYGEKFDCPGVAPISFADDVTAFLELWHGPTCAFKDMALQMLPYLLTASLEKNGEKRQVCILVATSGDTGKAALEGFADVAGTKIFVFYPKNGVSDIQRLQMVTQSGENVGVCAVNGNFDDAQTGVKKIFADREFADKLSSRGYFLSSANSINWGRLLPQIVYYFSAYCDFVSGGHITMGEKLDFCVPTGNFGNILAGWYAKQMGLPVGRLICASNENDVLTEFIRTGVYDKNREFHTTISPSMDILVSSNLERLLYHFCGSKKVSEYMQSLAQTGKYSVDEATLSKIQSDFRCGSCSDAETRESIRRQYDRNSYVMDTHTAVAWKVLDDIRRDSGAKRPAVIVSTASPFKFAADVLAALGGGEAGDPLGELSRNSGMPVPKPLSGLENREVRFRDAADREELISRLDNFLA